MIYKELSANDIKREFIAIDRGEYFSSSGCEILYDILVELSGEEDYRFNAFDVSLMFREVSAAYLAKDYSHYLDEGDPLDDDETPLGEDELADLIAERIQDRGVVVRGFAGCDGEARYIIGRGA